LVAGPIVRYKDVFEDLNNRKIISSNWFYGLQRFTVGLAKKTLIADPMGRVADVIFNTPTSDLSTAWAWWGVFCYSLQIFYDFSGYSDMAIGLGRIFNFRLLENFNLPYSANSVQEFWRRWHISLSSWFKDYLYIPLGGSRVNPIRTVINVWIVFLLCGLWHGAAWNFVAWGAWQGLGLTVERFGFSKVLKRFPKILSNLYVWLFLIFGWVLFRAENLSYAVGFFKLLLSGGSSHYYDFPVLFPYFRGEEILIALVGVLFCYLPCNKFFSSRKETSVVIILTMVLLLVAYLFALTSSFSPFIYFRF
jgi:alginate O-acetyltransferase complex protein AlgI